MSVRTDYIVETVNGFLSSYGILEPLEVEGRRVQCNDEKLSLIPEMKKVVFSHERGGECRITQCKESTQWSLGTSNGREHHRSHCRHPGCGSPP